MAQVRDLLRDEKKDDAALEAIARGDLDAPAAVQLLKRAERDPRVAAVVEASRPLSPRFEDRIVARVSGASLEPAPTPSAPAAEKLPASDTPAPRHGVVRVFARKASVVVAPLALAAALVLVMRSSGSTGEPAPSLPEYALSVSGEQTMRGATEASSANAPRLVLRSRTDVGFELVARPATSVPGKVVAYAFAIAEGEPNPIDASIDVSPDGAVRVRGRARALEGAREVRLVVGTASDSIARYEDAFVRAKDKKSDASVRVLVLPITRQ